MNSIVVYLSFLWRVTRSCYNELGVERLAALKHNRYLIYYKRATRFVEVAYMLHLSSILGLAFFFGFGILSISALESGSRHLFYIY
jgi:hypothetical protein